MSIIYFLSCSIFHRTVYTVYIYIYIDTLFSILSIKVRNILTYILCFVNLEYFLFASEVQNIYFRCEIKIIVTTSMIIMKVCYGIWFFLSFTLRFLKCLIKDSKVTPSRGVLVQFEMNGTCQRSQIRPGDCRLYSSPVHIPIIPLCLQHILWFLLF